MTLQAERAPAPPAPAQAQRNSEPDIEHRGRLDIAEAVVRKVVEYAADLTPGTARTTRRVAGVGVGERGASARITTHDDQVEVRLDVALHYPADVRDTVRGLREHVTAEVARVTGFRVRSMDVTVSALVPESHGRVR
jgi:uncharacterized alkaline shock family protein YloU